MKYILGTHRGLVGTGKQWPPPHRDERATFTIPTSHRQRHRLAFLFMLYAHHSQMFGSDLNDFTIPFHFIYFI